MRLMSVRCTVASLMTRASGSMSVFLLALMMTATLWAVDPNRRISQYSHTAWRLQEGAFKGAPYAIAQAENGYMWVGTAVGLYQFDGIRFVPWKSSDGTELSPASVFSLKRAPDGSMWIASTDGLKHLSQGHLTSVTDAQHIASAITLDSEGKLWFTRNKPKPLCHLVQERVQCFGPSDGVPFDHISGDALATDGSGNIWVGNDTAFLRWRPGSSTLYRPEGLRTNANLWGISSLASTSDGSVWAGAVFSGPGLGLQRMTQGAFHPFIASHFDSSSLEVRVLFVDRHQTLWVGTTHHGIYRITANKVDHFEAVNGLSGNEVVRFFEDAEGNLWVTTSGGVDKFSDLAIATYSTGEGVTTTEVDAVVAGHDGTLWIGGADALDVLRDGDVMPIRGEDKLHGKQVTSLLEDNKGQLLVGINNTLNVYENGSFRQLKRADGSAYGVVQDITEDSEKNIWVYGPGPPSALSKLRDLKELEQFPALRGHLAADRSGDLWLGSRGGVLTRLHKGKIDRFDFRLNSSARTVQVLTDFNGAVLGATSSGLIAWRDGKQRTLTVANGLPCDQIRAVIGDRSNNLWLYTRCGLVEIAATDVQRWWADPGSVVKPTTFDELKGFRSGQAPFQTAAKTPDGKLWFANNVSLQMVDPDNLYQNAVPPPVQISGIVADRKSYGPVQGLRLPALTRDLEIDYAGLSFMVPQNVRFRYKLSGHDTNWQEPDTRRQAFYNDLRPGTYVFNVLACNNDGVWNETGATLQFSIAPAWFQTVWFRIVWTMCACLLVWLTYHLRVRSIARSISARFDERLDERTRMALELHDTFLQTVQGSKIVADDALEPTADQTRMRQALEKLSLWLGQAVTEGRAALHALRVSTTEKNHLAEFLDRTAKAHAQRTSISVAIIVIGDAKDLHPIVRDEVARISEEAIRNACMHSNASQLTIELRYGREMSVIIKDNGVGMDPEVVDAGKVGHFGITGMRERSDRIRAKLTISSTLNSGTRVSLIIPGEVVYRREHRSLASKVKAFWANDAVQPRAPHDGKRKESNPD